MLLLLLSSILITTLAQGQGPTNGQGKGPPSSRCIGAYQQCGGFVANNAPYTGQTCCIAGHVCTAISSQYSQCNPVSSQPPPVGVTPSNPNIQPVTPVTPVNPPPVQQPPAQQPPTNSNPNIQPVTPVTPVIPQQPPATPQYGPNPYGYIPGMMDPQKLDCEFGQCRNRIITMQPAQGFTLNCNLYGQCDGLDLTLNVGHDPTNWGSGVSEINDLNFNAPQNGVTIRINGLHGIEINNIKCSVFGACTNLNIIAGYGVELWNMNVHCDQPGSCNGCMINGQSCLVYSAMNGNNNGYIPYGHGYTNQPNQPLYP